MWRYFLKCLKRQQTSLKLIHPQSGNLTFATSLVWDKNSGCFGNDAFLFRMLKFQGQTVESFWCVLDDLDIWNVSPPNKMQMPDVWKPYRYWSHKSKPWAIHVESVNSPFPSSVWECVSSSQRWHGFFADWVIHKSLSIPSTVRKLTQFSTEVFHFCRIFISDFHQSRIGMTGLIKLPILGASNNANVCQFWGISSKKVHQITTAAWAMPNNCFSYQWNHCSMHVNFERTSCQMEISRMDNQKAMDHFGKGYLCVWNMTFTGMISILKFNGISWDGSETPTRMPV